MLFIANHQRPTEISAHGDPVYFVVAAPAIDLSGWTVFGSVKLTGGIPGQALHIAVSNAVNGIVERVARCRFSIFCKSKDFAAQPSGDLCALRLASVAGAGVEVAIRPKSQNAPVVVAGFGYALQNDLLFDERFTFHFKANNVVLILDRFVDKYPAGFIEVWIQCQAQESAFALVKSRSLRELSFRSGSGVDAGDAAISLGYHQVPVGKQVHAPGHVQTGSNDGYVGFGHRDSRSFRQQG